MPAWILQVLQVGVNGFAIVFLFFGFKLYWKLLTERSRDQNLELTKIKFKEAKVYLGFSITILIIGIFAMVIFKDINYQLKLKVDPGVFDIGVDLPSVQVSKKLYKLDETPSGYLQLKVKNEELIIFSVEKLINYYKSKLTELVNGEGGRNLINNSQEGGFANGI